MRPERLERLLRAGGCLVEMDTGTWVLHRTHDRRQRHVAQISAAEIHALQAAGALVQRPSPGAACLVWSRNYVGAPLASLTEDRLPDLQKPPTGTPIALRGSLLTRILFRLADHKNRKRLAIAALNWRSDLVEAKSQGLAQGMNWNAVLAGTRIDGSAFSARGGSDQIGTERRVYAIKQRLGRAEIRLLDLMVLRDGSRHAIAKAMSCSETQIEKDGLRVLNRLANGYDRVVKRPDQATPSV
ncbi:MAG: hypothetical protein AAFO63_09340 [Pseudomonadota bacterium]